MNASLSVDRVKEQRDANKYPRRKCIKCIRYPCFKGQGTPMHQVNFAAYGCKQYSNHEVRTEKQGFELWGDDIDKQIESVDGHPFPLLTLEDAGHSSNVVAFYVIKKQFDVYTLAFKEFIG